MPTLEIKSTDWARFCKRFLDLHRGALITIHHINEAGYNHVIAESMPLQDIRFLSAACNDRIQVTLFLEGRREVTHEVIEPIHIKVREESAGSKGFQIDAENGSTILRFSSGKLDELLEGLSTT